MAKAKTEGRGLGRVWESHLCQLSQVDLRNIWRGLPNLLCQELRYRSPQVQNILFCSREVSVASLGLSDAIGLDLRFLHALRGQGAS